MDLFALTNMTGLAKAGNPQNMRFRRTTRPAGSDRQEEAFGLYDSMELSTINMKMEAEGASPSGSRQPVFADVMREAYERRKKLQL